MTVSAYFSACYREARVQFRVAARRADAGLRELVLPGHTGPNGEPLAMDIATLGPADATTGLLMLSGTHGVEGFCGSGCQVGFFADQLLDALPRGSRAVLVHAVNPYGFAWLRRVNEDGVDLNRNVVDFTKPLPPSDAYEELHDALVPQDWDGPARERADACLTAYVERHGVRALQAAVTTGQYTRPNGLFFGGTRTAWSVRTLRQQLAELLPATLRQLAVLDLHTGLGPMGYGDPIFVGGSEDEYERARAWYGEEVRRITAANSISPPTVGGMPGLVSTLLPPGVVTYVALEFGTLPLNDVLLALRADHWLHAVPNRATPLRAAIQRQIRDAFYVDSAHWRAAVYGRVADFVVRAGRGLSGA